MQVYAIESQWTVVFLETSSTDIEVKEPEYTIAVSPIPDTIHVGESIVYTVTHPKLPDGSYVYMQETEFYNGNNNPWSLVSRNPSDQWSSSRTFTVYGNDPGYTKLYFCYWVGNKKVQNRTLKSVEFNRFEGFSLKNICARHQNYLMLTQVYMKIMIMLHKKTENKI